MAGKRVANVDAAVADVPSGSTIMVGGFGGSGLPTVLIRALARQGARNLTVVANNLGVTGEGVATLVETGQLRRLICSYPVGAHARQFLDLYRQGQAEIEVIPQGTLAEKIRCGGAGIPAFFTATGVGTDIETGKEKRVIDGRTYLLEYALSADYALIKAHRADEAGNVLFRRAQRNFNEIMVKAARVGIAEVDQIVPVGGLDPERIDVPSIYVQRVVEVIP